MKKKLSPKNVFQKKIGLILFALSIIGVWFTFKPLISQTQPRTVETQAKITVSQKIIYSAKQKKESRKDILQQWTALQALQSIAQVKTQGEGKEAFIIAIDDRKADDSKKEFWAFYVNGKQAEIGAGSYSIKDGDSIEWRIENY